MKYEVGIIILLCNMNFNYFFLNILSQFIYLQNNYLSVLINVLSVWTNKNMSQMGHTQEVKHSDGKITIRFFRKYINGRN